MSNTESQHDGMKTSEPEIELVREIQAFIHENGVVDSSYGEFAFGEINLCWYSKAGRNSLSIWTDDQVSCYSVAKGGVSVKSYMFETIQELRDAYRIIVI